MATGRSVRLTVGRENRIVAVVLTGGASRRMGADKATLVVEGRRLVDRTVAVLRDAGVNEIVIAGPDPGGLAVDAASIHVVPDPEGPRQGPLSGLAAAWAHLLAVDERMIPSLLVAVSCDLPWITSTVVSELIDAASTHESGAQAFDGERAQPLVAAYPSATVELLHSAFRRGERSVRRILADTDLALVGFDRSVLRDVDEPADLAGVDVVWPGDLPDA